ncbi:RNA helicase family protein [Artemisia annua]|uniref:RNA helicase family protein n=1 Tax=Artemisia annua TaxID=35608 RepID=A0A2U1KEE1_ARTAN|nr:RNA helicase family protein [Artemisia annua]
MVSPKLYQLQCNGQSCDLLNVYKGLLLSNRSSKWCHQNSINYNAMKKVIEVRQQLRRVAQRLGLALKSCENDMQLFVKSYSHNGTYKTLRGSQEVYIHPSFVLFRCVYVRKYIKVKIPPGVTKGSILRVAGEGDIGLKGYIFYELC